MPYPVIAKTAQIIITLCVCVCVAKSRIESPLVALHCVVSRVLLTLSYHCKAK